MRARKTSLVIALTALALACTPKGRAPEKEAREPASDEEQAGHSPASGLMDGASLMAMSSMFSQVGEPGIYDAPKQSSGFSASSPHMLTLALGGEVKELHSMSLFDTDSSIELRELQARLRELAADDNVKSLLLRVDGLGIGMAVAQELRESLLAFKGEGARSLYCHTEGSSNISYYLLSACDSIGIAPTGEIVISGVAAMPLHLKGLLDKLGIKADFLHVGDYKGAAEPLTLDEPSEATNETIAAILDQGYATLVSGIAQGRKLQPDAVRGLIDTAMFSSREAVAAKLADREATYEAYRAEVGGDLPWKRVAVKKKDKNQGFGQIMELVGLQPRRRDRSDHIAVVYAVGNIIDGAGQGLIGSRNEIASHTLVSALRALREADSVKGVVLRVSSGGGSALASELIWHAMQDLKAVKPVVVSMGGMAASGGYYISCGANRIFADANTMTGSIGVVGGKLAIGGALEKIGIRTFPVGRGKRSLMWSSMDRWNDDERAAIQKMMEDIYKVFVERVAAGRGKSYEQIHAIAQGRVWTGKAALENGLVDEIGGLEAAIAHGAELAGMRDPGELEIYPPMPTLMDYVSSFSSGASVQTRAVLREARALLGPRAESVLRRTLAQVSSFRDSAVQTTLLLPVLWQ